MKRRKLFISIFVCTLTCITLYIAYQFWFIETTEDIPYRNLREFSFGSCYIYINIKHKDKVYPIVFENRPLASILKRSNGIGEFIYPVYMNQIIQNDWSLDVSDSLFSEIRHSIVNPDLVERFKIYDPILDTTYIKDNRITYEVSQDEQNAIVFVLLKRGINCCVNHQSGAIHVYP